MFSLSVDTLIITKYDYFITVSIYPSIPEFCFLPLTEYKSHIAPTFIRNSSVYRKKLHFTIHSKTTSVPFPRFKTFCVTIPLSLLTLPSLFIPPSRCTSQDHYGQLLGTKVTLYQHKCYHHSCMLVPSWCKRREA